MMIQEFETLTGLTVTPNEYDTIEQMYYEFDGDKREFCKDFMANNRIIEVLRMIATDFEAQKAEALSDLHIANEKIRRLEAALDRELEWQPYVDPNNYQQADYDHLRSAGRVMTDDEAKDLLYDWFGFAREKVTIHHKIGSPE